MEKLKTRKNKVILGIIILLFSLIVIYIGFSIYFKNRFYLGASINSVSVAGKTVQEADSALSSEVQNYTLSLEERDGKKEEIKSSDIGLKYNSGNKIQEVKDEENNSIWLSAIFSENEKEVKDIISYDENLLAQKIDKLSCFDASSVVEPENPKFQYGEGGYTIIPEVEGNKVNKEVLVSEVSKAIKNGKTSIDLDSLQCYVKPKFTQDSEEAKAAKATLDKYTSSNVTYTIGGNNEVVNGSLISQWVNVDDNLAVTINNDKVSEYVQSLAKKYNTVGITRQFQTTGGSTISVEGGDYGRAINKKNEAAALLANIQEGQTVSKEPEYSQKALSADGNDIGNTYVEISLSGQHLWFYKNGGLITEGDIVSGNPNAGHATPAGVYYVKDIERNAILRGDGYATPVTFWMPFNGGIGMHDASWQNGVFGGHKYLTNGSHGCINCSYSLAQSIFNNMEIGIPVVCYH